MQQALFLITLVAAAPAGPGTVELARGAKAFWAGDYAEAAHALESLAPRLPRNADYAAYLAAESVFFAGSPARARPLYEALARQRGSRFAALAPWRAADCLWAEGKRADA